jgi:hypothetical protein
MRLFSRRFEDAGGRTHGQTLAVHRGRKPPYLISDIALVGHPRY